MHDLRHTVGMRLREASVPESTVADILWHSSPSMTRHYSVAQIVEPHAAAGTRAWRHFGASMKKQKRRG